MHPYNDLIERMKRVLRIAQTARSARHQLALMLADNVSQDTKFRIGTLEFMGERRRVTVVFTDALGTASTTTVNTCCAR